MKFAEKRLSVCVCVCVGERERGVPTPRPWVTPRAVPPQSSTSTSPPQSTEHPGSQLISRTVT